MSTSYYITHKLQQLCLQSTFCIRQTIYILITEKRFLFFSFQNVLYYFKYINVLKHSYLIHRTVFIVIFLLFFGEETLFNWQKLWHKESEGCRLNWLFAQSCVSARCSTPRGNNVKQITRSNAGELLSLASFINLFLSRSNWLSHTSLSLGFYIKAGYAFVS